MLACGSPTSVGMAADFVFAWDPPASRTRPQGYFLYFHAGASVLEDSNNANIVYIQATDPDFDPDLPVHVLTGLDDDVYYSFVITADYIDQESAFSNEVIGLNGKSVVVDEPIAVLNKSPGTTSNSNGSGGGGCFIGVQRWLE